MKEEEHMVATHPTYNIQNQQDVKKISQIKSSQYNNYRTWLYLFHLIMPTYRFGWQMFQHQEQSDYIGKKNKSKLHTDKNTCYLMATLIWSVNMCLITMIKMKNINVCKMLRLNKIFLVHSKYIASNGT